MRRQSTDHFVGIGEQRQWNGEAEHVSPAPPASHARMSPAAQWHNKLGCRHGPAPSYYAGPVPCPSLTER